MVSGANGSKRTFITLAEHADLRLRQDQVIVIECQHLAGAQALQ